MLYNQKKVVIISQGYLAHHIHDVVVLDQGVDNLRVQFVGLLLGALVARTAANVGAERENGGRSDLWHRVRDQFDQKLVGRVAHALPPRVRVVLPAEAQANAAPLSEQAVLVVVAALVGDEAYAQGDQVVVFGALLAARVVVDQTGEDKD